MRNAGRSRMDASIRFLTNNFRRLKNSAPRVALPWRAASVGVQYADYAKFFFYRASLIKKSVTDARLAASKGRVGAYNIVGVMFASRGCERTADTNLFIPSRRDLEGCAYDNKYQRRSSMKRFLALLLFAVFMAIGLFSTFSNALQRSVWSAQTGASAHQEPVVKGEVVADGVAITYFDGSGLSEYRIPDEYDGQPVVEIGESAFADCDLSRVFIPSSVKRIGKQAFCGCPDLKRVDLLNGIESIGAEAFKDCSSLTDVVIPASVKEIGARAFAGCSSLDRVELPSGLESIGEDAFEDCTATLYVYSGSYAEKWANENDCDHETLGEASPDANVDEDEAPVLETRIEEAPAEEASVPDADLDETLGDAAADAGVDSAEATEGELVDLDVDDTTAEESPDTFNGIEEPIGGAASGQNADVEGATENEISTADFEEFGAEDASEKDPFTEDFDVKDVAASPKTPVEWRVFLVAVNEYDAKFPDLSYAENDARELRRAFLNLGVPEENITLLTSSGDSNGGESTCQNINEKYDEFVANLPKGSAAFVFFAGHGFSKRVVKDSQDFAFENYQSQFLPKDSLWNDNLIPIERLVRKLSGSQARFKWICIDACRNIFSEEFLAHQKGDSDVANVMLSPEPPAGLLLMQSCSLNQSATEGVLYEHGLFTKALLDVLRGEARVNQRGVGALRQIHDYLIEKVKDDAKLISEKSYRELEKSGKVDQTPTFWISEVPPGEEDLFWDEELLVFPEPPLDATPEPEEPTSFVTSDGEPPSATSDVANKTEEPTVSATSDVETSSPPPAADSSTTEPQNRDYRILILAGVVIAAIWLVPRFMRSRAKTRERRKGRRRSKPITAPKPSKPIASQPTPIKPEEVPPAPVETIAPPPEPTVSITPQPESIEPVGSPLEPTASIAAITPQSESVEADAEGLESEDETIDLIDEASDDLSETESETFVIDGASSETSASSEGNFDEEPEGVAAPQLDASSGPAPLPQLEPAPAATRKAGAALTVAICGQNTRFRWCPAGTFLMGSPEFEDRRKEDERQRVVTISRGFWIAESPTNQSLWSAVMGWNPSRFTGMPTRPVERVEWEQCMDFIDHLNAEHAPSGGLLYALPTEAQWEYACRAGTTTPFSFGDTLNGVMANCNGRHPYGTNVQGYRHRATTTPGTYYANPWGIFDMHGNVWEWCHDWYGEYMGESAIDPQGPDSGEYRVVRGGSWHFHPRHCRSASRYCGKPHARKSELGFRMVLLEIGD